MEEQYCEICGKLKGYWDEEKNAWIEIITHRTCSNIRKFANMSILESNYRQDNFENAVYENDIENNFYNDFQIYCENFEEAKKEGIGIIMLGNAGTGKTFATHCIINELQRKGNTVLAFNISKYLSEIKSEGFDEREKEIMDNIKKVDLVVIDDIGNERLTDWGMERLFNLFNTIYMNRKSLVCSTNLTGIQLRQHLKIKNSDKIIDRILELCKIYTFNWESKRQKKGNEKFEKLWRK